MKSSILVVDDDPKMSEIISAVLEQGGYKVHVAEAADEVFDFLKTNLPDLILLDIDLPGLSGLKLLEIIRSGPVTAQVPIIMITVQDSESYKMKGFSGGADDYLIKPFSLKELLARVEAILRRTQRGGQPSKVVEAGGISVDFERREVRAGTQLVELTPTEFEFLALVIQRKDTVLNYSAIADHLAASKKSMTSGNLYVLVNSIRKKLGPLGLRVATVHGIGYKFSDD